VLTGCRVGTETTLLKKKKWGGEGPSGSTNQQKSERWGKEWVKGKLFSRIDRLLRRQRKRKTNIGFTRILIERATQQQRRNGQRLYVPWGGYGKGGENRAEGDRMKGWQRRKADGQGESAKLPAGAVNDALKAI